MSAAGGLAGALLNARAASPALTIVLGSVLVLAGAAQVTGAARRWRFHGSVAWIAGAVSGLFGGLVGNQGGIRSAAMLGFDLSEGAASSRPRPRSRCSSTRRGCRSIWWPQRAQVVAIWPLVLIATVGVIAGTLSGERLLAKVPEQRFKQVVGAIILLLGIVILLRRNA